MKIQKKLLLIGLLFGSVTVFAAPALTYVEVGKLEGSVPANQDVQLSIHYKWLSDGTRNGEINYGVAGTACKGKVPLDEFPAYTKVEGDAKVTCNFATGGTTYPTTTSLQLYDGNVPKEKADNSAQLQVQ